MSKALRGSIRATIVSAVLACPGLLLQLLSTFIYHEPLSKIATIFFVMGGVVMTATTIAILLILGLSLAETALPIEEADQNE